MKSLPLSLSDKALLNGRNVAETIIGHIKEFPSLRLPKHRSVFNALTHIVAAIIAYQIDSLLPRLRAWLGLGLRRLAEGLLGGKAKAGHRF